MITLRQLRYLTALARHRHFGRAAEDCAVSQPALSMQIRELEREIGAELVERRPNEMVLTDTGLQVARARRTNARRHPRSRRFRAPPRGAQRAAASSASSRHSRLMYCRACCRDCRRNIRDLRLELRETQTKMLLEELVRGELDCVMLALPVGRCRSRDAAAVRRSVPAGGAAPTNGRCAAASTSRTSISAG